MELRGVRVVPVALVTAAVGSSVSLAAALVPAGYTNNGSLANRRAAQRDASRLLRRVNLPAGATKVAGEPAGDSGYLKPMLSLEADPANSQAHAWWTVPGSPAAVSAYIAAHVPAGSRLESTGSGGNFKTGTSETTREYKWPAVRRVLGDRLLQLTVTQLPGGRTGVLAQSQSDYVVLRPITERVVKSRAVLVTVKTRQGSTTTSLRVSAPRQIARLVKLANSLPVVQPGTAHCPAEIFTGPWPKQVTVRYLPLKGKRASVLGFAAYRAAPGPATQCDPITVRIGGHRRASLTGSWVGPLQRVLGRKLL